MGCTASRHLGRHSSMEQCSSPSPMTPERTSTCTMKYSVEYHQHIVALTSSSYGRIKVGRPSETRDLSSQATSRVGSLHEMYNKLISLEMTHEPALHSPLGRDSLSSRMLHTPLAGREASSSPSNQHEGHINSAEFVISETINVRELMMGFEERVSPRELASTITKMPLAQRGAPILRQPSKKILEKPFHTVEEAEVLAKCGKVIQHGLDEDEYESGKENNKPEHGCHVKCPLASSPLSQISQSALSLRDAQERGSPSTIKSSPFTSISEAKKNAAFKYGRSEPALHCTQQQRKKLAPSSVTPLSASMSRRRVELKENTDPSSPLFDPNMVASYEKALQNISEGNWNACLVDSPEMSDRQRACVAMPNEQRDAIVSGCKSYSSKGEGKRPHDALDCYAMKCPPGGNESIVLYTTTLRGIRKTFEDCNKMRRILQSYGLSFDERDVSMHLGFLNELRGLMDRVLSVPRLFIKGRYIGGVEELGKLHEDGKLREIVEGLPKQGKRGKCEGCDGIRFVPCLECRGSCKIRCEDNKVIRCPDCNENGLIQCPICT